MSISLIVQRTVQGGTDFLTKAETVEDTGLISVSEEVAISGSTAVTAVVDVSLLKLAYIATDVDDTTFDFDGTTPTLTIKANTPYLWTEFCNLTNALSDDFTTCTVTNPSASVAANIQMRFLYAV